MDEFIYNFVYNINYIPRNMYIINCTKTNTGLLLEYIPYYIIIFSYIIVINNEG